MPLSDTAIRKARPLDKTQRLFDGGACTRKDVTVIVDGMPLAPAAGVGSWAAISPMGEQAMVMGDADVFRDEVDSAIDAACAHGLTVTGPHTIVRRAPRHPCPTKH